MGSGQVVWTEIPDEDRVETDDTQAHVDETFAVRRLRRWLNGMFGGDPSPQEEAEDDPKG
jgi:hypothetical protein